MGHDVCVIGVGRTPVGEHWEQDLRQLAVTAMNLAIEDACVQPDNISSLAVGNMLAASLDGQLNLGAMLAAEMGWMGIEATNLGGSEAAGAAALRQAYLSVCSGEHPFALALGVEKVTDHLDEQVDTALAGSLDIGFEAAMGVHPTALHAMLMQRYLHEYKATREDFFLFSELAHQNASRNPNAMYPFPLKKSTWLNSPMLAEPLGVLDCASRADGAVALILCREDWARRLVPHALKIRASVVSSDALSLHSRKEPLLFEAALRSASKAYEDARINPKDVDVFELHDSTCILSALSLEASGFADRGCALDLLKSGALGLEGQLPISTMGGHKARGYAPGASGLDQVADVALQLRGLAGANQVKNARLAMTQSVGGIGSLAITHIFEQVG